jgi:hypothetical protein
VLVFQWYDITRPVVSHRSRWCPMLPCDDARDRTRTHDIDTTVVHDRTMSYDHTHNFRIMQKMLAPFQGNQFESGSSLCVCNRLSLWGGITAMAQWSYDNARACHTMWLRWSTTLTVVEHIINISKYDCSAYDVQTLPPGRKHYRRGANIIAGAQTLTPEAENHMTFVAKHLPCVT